MKNKYSKKDWINMIHNPDFMEKAPWLYNADSYAGRFSADGVLVFCRVSDIDGETIWFLADVSAAPDYKPSMSRLDAAVSFLKWYNRTQNDYLGDPTPMVGNTIPLFWPHVLPGLKSNSKLMKDNVGIYTHMSAEDVEKLPKVQLLKEN